MPQVHLTPEKITHPFQLMAAWFVMLILLVGALLTGAAKIETPAWIPGFLVISCVSLSILVMAAVFVMLTRYRPHLQGPREYFEWLKEERRFRVQSIQTVELQEATGPVVGPPSADVIVPRRRRPRRRPVTTFRLSNLEGAGAVLESLSESGFRAKIYNRSEDESNEPEDQPYGEKSEHAAIWVGSNVPADVAIKSIKSVVKIWTHLCYMAISGEHGENPPDEIHYEMFFGGATGTAINDGLKKWTLAEIAAIPDHLALADFQSLIREKYKKVQNSETF